MDRRKSRSSMTDAAQRRVFPCSFDGCNRSFTRSEHLHRHALNHAEGDSTCPRCRAHFKRKDLLERHMNRHRQKDEEAARGEGTGVLNTRKRMWKDHNGHIVAKRPKHSTGSAESESPIDGSHVPISPPISSENPDLASDHIPTHEALISDQAFIPDVPDVTDVTDVHFASGQYVGGHDYGGWLPAQQLQRSLVDASAGTQIDISYDDVFQPDTASSFNMPYTTQFNYNWLFNLPGGLDEPSTAPVTHPPIAMFPMAQGFEQPSVMTSLDPSLHRQGQSHDNAATHHHTPDSLSSSQLQVTHPSPERTCSTRGDKSGSDTSSKERNASPPLGVGFERPLSFLRPPQNLPLINKFAYNRILETIESARPLAPDGTLFDMRQPLLSISSLQGYCDLYFTKFNTAYPLIHQPTFDVSRCETLLLLSIILLGATYSDKDAHQLAVCVHDVIRPQIFSHASFNAKPDLWVLQTILLVECFDCQSIRPNRSIKNSGGRPAEPEVLWRQWVEAEEKKRLALLCFMWDTQHAVLFCQSLCMSAFELKLPLPCEQVMWEASTATEWMHLNQICVPEPMFLLALRSYLTPDAKKPFLLNGLSRIIIFHGLMSVFWDMERRDQTSLGVIPSQTTGRWQTRLETAYHRWKVDFDSYCRELRATTDAEINKGAVMDGAAVKAEADAWRTAYVAVYHAAHVLLYSAFLDMQIYAGARHILGKPVQRTDYLRSERVVKRWAGRASEPTSGAGAGDAQVSSSFSSPDNDRTNAAIAAWHAAHLLRAAKQTLSDYDSMGLFHVPWCLYLATLTIWAFHHVGGDHGDMVWDAEAEMQAVVDAMADSEPHMLLAMQGTRRTGGLVHYFAGVLSKVRWGIVHAGVAVLKGLVPSRLVCQFDGVR